MDRITSKQRKNKRKKILLRTIMEAVERHDLPGFERTWHMKEVHFNTGYNYINKITHLILS